MFEINSVAINHRRLRRSKSARRLYDIFNTLGVSTFDSDLGSAPKSRVRTLGVNREWRER